MNQIKRLKPNTEQRTLPASGWLTTAFHAAVVTLFWFNIQGVIGQVPVIKEPQPSSFNQVLIGSNQNSNITNVPNNSSNDPLYQYKQDQKELQKRNETLNKVLNKQTLNRQIQYDLPSLANQPGAEHYRNAATKLNSMLRGAEPMSLKRAVFMTENAYLGGRLKYDDFNKQIQKLVFIAKLKAGQSGYDWNNPQTRNIMLFRVLADTLEVKDASSEGGTATSYPMQYDFDDIMGTNNWTKMFVSKLLKTKTGQCHSLPLLYLILCEETNTQANLAFSPSHSYAKFKDKSGNWYNVELTNGRIVSDAFITASGYITSEALKNHLYMEPQTKRQTIANCLNDLAIGYSQKYGYDGFISQCADTTLKYTPANISARQMKANYQTHRFEYVVNQVGRPHPDVLKSQYPKVYRLLEERDKTYRFIDESGFQAMPIEAYQAWLKSLNEEKAKQENQGLMLRLTKTLN